MSHIHTEFIHSLCGALVLEPVFCVVPTLCFHDSDILQVYALLLFHYHPFTFLYQLHFIF